MLPIIEGDKATPLRAARPDALAARPAAVGRRSILVLFPLRGYAGKVFTIQVREPRSIAGRCWNAGQGVLSLGSLALIALKLAGVIDWSWWWVLSPLWIGGVLLVTVLGGLAVLIGWGWTEKGEKSRKRPARRPSAP
jgi:hypothetical protein